jgi:hypothetical protein
MDVFTHNVTRKGDKKKSIALTVMWQKNVQKEMLHFVIQKLHLCTIQQNNTVVPYEIQNFEFQ